MGNEDRPGMFHTWADAVVFLVWVMLVGGTFVLIGAVLFLLLR